MEAPVLGSSELSIPTFSNIELDRDPAFTTYHNILVDLGAAGGLVALTFFTIFTAICFHRARGSHRITLAFLLAPALFNSYLPFAPNPLGVIVAAALVFICRLNKEELGVLDRHE